MQAQQNTAHLLEAREEASEFIGRELTDAEWADAYTAAEQKLQRIIGAYGDAGGARMAPWYLGQLVQESMAEAAMMAYYNGDRAQKRPPPKRTAFHTTTNISPTQQYVNTGRRR